MPGRSAWARPWDPRLPESCPAAPGSSPTRAGPRPVRRGSGGLAASPAVAGSASTWLIRRLFNDRSPLSSRPKCIHAVSTILYTSMCMREPFTSADLGSTSDWVHAFRRLFRSRSPPADPSSPAFKPRARASRGPTRRQRHPRPRG
jgi:hypothetical protein